MRKINTFENYIHLYELGIDSSKLYETCVTMYEYIINEFSNVPGKDYGGQATITTRLYRRYNLLLYPMPQIWDLYHTIAAAFRNECKDNLPYFIRCWLNVYKQDDFIDWHTHRPIIDVYPDYWHGWHGYYCVRGNDTITTYRITDIDKKVDIINKEDQLILGRANSDSHRTYPWRGEGERITIAFDILREKDALAEGGNNHWIPI